MESEGSLTSYEPFTPRNLSLQFPSNVNEHQNASMRLRNEELAKIEMGVLSSLFILSLLGNLIVVLGIYFRRQKMSRMYYFILHLSIADLVTAFFNVGAQFVMELTFPQFIGNDFLCKLVKFMQILGPYSSSYVLVMTAIDRYKAICYPLSNCTWTAGQSKRMLVIAWLISCFFCVPQLFIFSLQDVMGYPDCWANFPVGVQEVYVTWYAVSVFIVPLLFLIFTYTCICRTIWENFNMKTKATKQEYEGSGMGHGLCEPGNQICDNEAAVSTRKEEGNDNGLLIHKSSASDRDASTTLDISWRLDKKGNVNTFSGHPPTRVTRSDSFPNEKLPDGDDVEDELGSHDIRILQTDIIGVPAVETCHSPNLQNSVTRILEPKSKMLKSTQKFKPNDKNNSLLLISSNQNKTTKPVDSKNNANENRAEFSYRKRLQTNDSMTQPRSSSVEGISRAKIKTVKLTVTVICCYIFCSSPFVTTQLWVTFDPNAYQSKFYTGTTFTILTLLASLNSCVNPWIFLLFNSDILQNFLRGIGCTDKWPMRKCMEQTSREFPMTQNT